MLYRVLTHDSGRGVDSPGESVDTDNVGCLVVPGAILAPVCRRHLLPGVVEVAGR